MIVDTMSDLLWTIANVAGRDGAGEWDAPAPRKRVLHDGCHVRPWESGPEPSERRRVNALLRAAARAGLVELTRDTVRLTAAGLRELN